MGVERFFSSINKEFNITKNTHYPYKKVKGKYFLIDFNSIVHVLSAHMLSMGIYDNTKDFEENLLKQIKLNLIDLLTNNLNNNDIEYIYIAIDGTPTMGKIYEQKKRRYMASLINYIKQQEKIKSSTFTWEKNNISPGTKFMAKLEKMLKHLYTDFKKVCPNLKRYLLSDTSEEGEGEMKIINYIKQYHLKNNVIVYSPDSDMIILLMMLNIESIILRYDQQQSKLDDKFRGKIYNIINVTQFKQILYKYIQTRGNPYVKLNEQKVINDIAFLFTIFGDDFLPKLETVRVSSDIYIIIDLYIVNQNNNGYLLDNDNKIKLISFHNLLNLISINEIHFLERNKQEHIYSNYNRVETDILGYNLYIFREMVNELFWCFIYENRDNLNNKTVNPHNIHQFFDKNALFNFIETYFINVSKTINVIDLEKYSDRKFKYLDTNIFDELKTIFMDNYLLFLKYMDVDNFFKIINKYNRTKIVNEYQKLYYLMESKYNFLMDILLYMYYSSLDTPIINSVNITNSKPKLLNTSYSSKEMPHKKNLSSKSEKEAFMYKLEKKLDNYKDMLYPEDKFYLNDMKDDYYKLNFDVDKTTVIKEYLRGLNWVNNYYFNNIIDRGWYYKYGKSPLLTDIVNYMNKHKTNLRDDIVDDMKNYFTPLSQILFITPIDYNNDIYKQLSIINTDNIEKYVEFVKNNKEFYFPLNKIYDEIYNNTTKHIDCSSSIFISKCHLLFLEKDININNFLQKVM